MAQSCLSRYEGVCYTQLCAVCGKLDCTVHRLWWGTGSPAHLQKKGYRTDLQTDVFAAEPARRTDRRTGTHSCTRGLHGEVR